MAFAELPKSGRTHSGLRIVDYGADSTVFLHEDKRMVVKRYPRNSFGDIDIYRQVSVACAEFLYSHPIQQTINGQRYVLQDVTPVAGLEYDQTDDCWSALSPVVPGPHLSATAFNPDLFMELIQGLESQEQQELMKFQAEFCLSGRAVRSGIDRMLKDAQAKLVKVTRNPGVDLIYLNTKVRHYPEEDFRRLIVTDVSPSLNRVVSRSSVYVA